MVWVSIESEYTIRKSVNAILDTGSTIYDAPNILFLDILVSSNDELKNWTMIRVCVRGGLVKLNLI